MAFRAGDEAKTLSGTIRRNAPKASRSFDLQKYIGSPNPVLGLSTPRMHEIVRAFVSAHGDLTAKQVNALARALWRGRVHEEKSLALSLMSRYHGVLDDASWRLLDTFVDDCVGWGMCDHIGSYPIAKMAYAKPSRFRDLLRWTASKNFWRRRVAVYALHDWVLAGELDRPFQLLRRLLYDDEFWVQRAVGTWLRECWKKDRKRTEAFLRKHVRGLPRVVITVATERAPKAFREELRRSREKRAKKTL